jgi:hypothetical protein
LAPVRFRYGYVRSDGLVLSINQDPEAEFVLRDFEVVCYTGFKGGVCLSLENPELGKFGGGEIFVIERSEIKSLMALEGVVGNDLYNEVISRDDDDTIQWGTHLCGKVQMLLVFFPSPCLHLLSFLIKALLYKT